MPLSCIKHNGNNIWKLYPSQLGTKHHGSNHLLFLPKILFSQMDRPTGYLFHSRNKIPIQETRSPQFKPDKIQTVSNSDKIQTVYYILHLLCYPFCKKLLGKKYVLE